MTHIYPTRKIPTGLDVSPSGKYALWLERDNRVVGRINLKTFACTRFELEDGVDSNGVHTHACRHTHAHTHTHLRTRTHMHALALAHGHAHGHAHAHTHTHSHFHLHSCSHTGVSDLMKDKKNSEYKPQKYVPISAKKMGAVYKCLLRVNSE